MNQVTLQRWLSRAAAQSASRLIVVGFGGCENVLEDDMRRLAELPLLGVVLVGITWVLLSMFAPLLWMNIQMELQMRSLQRTGGVAGTTVQVDGLIVLLPPLVFCVAWVFARHRARRRVAHRDV